MLGGWEEECCCPLAGLVSFWHLPALAHNHFSCRSTYIFLASQCQFPMGISMFYHMREVSGPSHPARQRKVVLSFCLIWTLKYYLYPIITSETPTKAPRSWCRLVKPVGMHCDLWLAKTHPAGLRAALCMPSCWMSKCDDRCTELRPAPGNSI